MAIPRLLLVSVVALAGPAALAADSAVILQYHHFGSATPQSTSVTVDQFEAHLAYLEEQDFAVWPLEKIIGRLRAGEPLPERCIAITIDDAYASVYQEAFPRLGARGWPFTVFVSTGGVDQGLATYVTYDQMRAMAAAGATFGAHSHSHAFLIRRKPQESEASWRRRVTADIETSRRRLQDELGSRITLFAYPYGEYDNALKALVLELGFIGLGQQSGAVWRGSDHGVLPRFPMAGTYAEMGSFRTKVNCLPLPVLAATPADPTLPADSGRPVLRLLLAPGAYQADQFACFASGQGRIAHCWIDRAQGLMEITPTSDLPMGRSRFNCTAPHESAGRYFWYSHLWIRGEVHQD